MTTTIKIALVLASLICACHFDPVGESLATESSSSTDGGTFVTTTQTTGATAITTTSATTTTDGSESGDATSTETFGDDATTTYSESSTGEVQSHALAFNGGLAISDETALVDFDGDPYTIEMWLQIDQSAEGVIFDTTVTVAGPNGLTLVRDSAWTGNDNVVFYDFGTTPESRLDGDDPASWSPQWHHLAVTHDGSVAKIWIDGSEISSLQVIAQADNATAPVAIGSQPTTPFPPLVGVVVDELRISRAVLYDVPFVPELPLGDDESALHWTFDEGEGTAAVDSIEGLQITIDAGVSWISGQ
jgi:hypothetical protein